MSYQIRCPNNHVIRIDEKQFGTKLRCAQCQVLMLIEHPPAPPPGRRRQAPPPDDRFEAAAGLPPAEPRPLDDWQPSKKRAGMKKAQRMRLTRLGLGFQYAKVTCILAAVICLCLAFVLGLLTGLGLADGTFLIAILGFVVNALTVVTPILSAVGSVLCLWVPQKTGSKVFVIISGILDVLALVAFVTGVFFLVAASVAPPPRMAPGPPMRTSPVAAVAGLAGLALVGGVLLEFVAWILFMLFLRALLLYFKDRGGAREVLAALVLSICVTVGSPIYFGVGILVTTALPALLGLGTILVMVVIWIAAGIYVLRRIQSAIAWARGHLEKWA